MEKQEMKSKLLGFLDKLFSDGELSPDFINLIINKIPRTLEMEAIATMKRYLVDYLLVGGYFDNVKVTKVYFWEYFANLAYNLTKLALYCDTRKLEIFEHENVCGFYNLKGENTNNANSILLEMLMEFLEKSNEGYSHREKTHSSLRNEESWVFIFAQNFFNKLEFVFDFKEFPQTRPSSAIHNFCRASKRVRNDLHVIMNLYGPKTFDKFVNFIMDGYKTPTKSTVQARKSSFYGINLIDLLDPVAENTLFVMRDFNSSLARLFDAALKRHSDLDEIVEYLSKLLMALKYGPKEVSFYKTYETLLKERLQNQGWSSGFMEELVLKHMLGYSEDKRIREILERSVQTLKKAMSKSVFEDFNSKDADKVKNIQEKRNIPPTNEASTSVDRVSTDSKTAKKISQTQDDVLAQPKVTSGSNEVSPEKTLPPSPTPTEVFRNKAIDKLNLQLFCAISKLLKQAGTMGHKELLDEIKRMDGDWDETVIENTITQLEVSGYLTRAHLPEQTVYIYVF